MRATYGSCDVVFFLNIATAYTHKPICPHNSSKDVVWCKEDPFRDKKNVFVKFEGAIPQKHPYNCPEWAITSQNKM